MDNLSHLFTTTARRVVWQRSANALGFFLPLGIAVFFLGYGLVLACSLPIGVSFLPPVIVCGFLLHSLRQEKKGCQDERIAGLLDEKTAGQERFLTLATLPAPSDFLAQIRSEAARKAAFFVPERDLPFQLDRRVPLACVGAVLSGLLFLFLPSGSAALAPSSPSPVVPTPETLLQDIEDLARQLVRPQSAPEEQQAGAQLLVLAHDLKNPALAPQEKIRLIDEAQKRLKLPLSVPQILPLDFKFFGSDSTQDESPGNQGDSPQPENTPLAKTNENLEQLKQSLSAQRDGSQPGTQNTNQTDQADNQQSPKQQNAPQESGAGIKFDQPQSQEQKKQARQNTPGQQQQGPQSGQQPDAQQPPSGGDPRKAGHEPRRHATQQSNEQKQPQQAPEQSDPQPGQSGGQGKGERFYKPGEQPGGFLTQAVGYVKVRIPTGIKAEQDSRELTENTSPAVPTTPYSNAPLADRPPEKNAPQQRIPLEYRAILQKE